MATPEPPSQESGPAPRKRRRFRPWRPRRRGGEGGSVALAGGVNFLAGLWFIISPWLFGYSQHRPAFWNSAVLGVIVFLVAAWSAAASSAVTYEA